MSTKKPEAPTSETRIAGWEVNSTTILIDRTVQAMHKCSAEAKRAGIGQLVHVYPCEGDQPGGIISTDGHMLSKIELPSYKGPMANLRIEGAKLTATDWLMLDLQHTQLSQVKRMEQYAGAWADGSKSKSFESMKGKLVKLTLLDDCEFPDWRQVVPPDERKRALGLDISLAAKAATMLCGGEASRWFPASGTDPILVSGQAQGVWAKTPMELILMPTRLDDWEWNNPQQMEPEAHDEQRELDRKTIATLRSELDQINDLHKQEEANLRRQRDIYKSERDGLANQVKELMLRLSELEGEHGDLVQEATDSYNEGYNDAMQAAGVKEVA